MKSLNKLLIAAHPDDESLFAGSLLMTQNNWKVICVTCGYDDIRKSEFKTAMKFANINNFEIWEYEDITEWSNKIQEEISNRLKVIIDEEKYDMIITHNKIGEYGHQQHKLLHKIVKVLTKDNLYVFGKSPLRLQFDDLTKKIKLLDVYKTQSIWNVDDLIPWITNEKLEKFDG
jgi:LmbE family N-acetylglucosaminyl deacetylase|tara:strand:- start:772 stop:1293 length:522 start_codon:yes stop_codon:yes gene_type:complete